MGGRCSSFEKRRYRQRCPIAECLERPQPLINDGAPLSSCTLLSGALISGLTHLRKRILHSIPFLSLLAFSAAPSLADTVSYQYDALGRLQRVEHSDGSAITYDLDPAGNRTQVSVTLPPGAPPSISVPSSSTTGNYTISWGAPSGTVTSYKLYEATNSSFTGQVEVYSGTGTSKAISGKGNGTYYYRVRACNGSGCSGYRTGGNGVVVTLPPGVPSSISVPSSNNDGSYSVSWGAASGTVTAYKLYEATNSSFSGQVQVYSGTATSKAISGKGNGTYYYRVRACNGSGCSGYRTGSNGVAVLLPPGTPPSISVTLINEPNYRVSWGASSGTVTSYKLYRSFYSNFSSQTLIYSGTETSKFFPHPSSSTTYYFRVRACNSSGCSSYRTSGAVYFSSGGGGGGGHDLDSVDPGTEEPATSEPVGETQ